MMARAWLVVAVFAVAVSMGGFVGGWALPTMRAQGGTLDFCTDRVGAWSITSEDKLDVILDTAPASDPLDGDEVTPEAAEWMASFRIILHKDYERGDLDKLQQVRACMDGEIVSDDGSLDQIALLEQRIAELEAQMETTIVWQGATASSLVGVVIADYGPLPPPHPSGIQLECNIYHNPRPQQSIYDGNYILQCLP